MSLVNGPLAWFPQTSESEEEKVNITWEDLQNAIHASYVAEIVKFSWSADMNCLSRKRWTQVVLDTYPRLNVGDADGRQLFDAFPDPWVLKVRAPMFTHTHIMETGHDHWALPASSCLLPGLLYGFSNEGGSRAKEPRPQ